MVDRPRNPYQEITTPENAEIHSNIKRQTWRGLQTLEARSRFFQAMPGNLSGKALEDACKTILRTAGSIDGKHRDSTTQAVQGQKAPTLALGVPQQPAVPEKGRPSL